MKAKDFARSFFAAWELMLDLPLPASLTRKFRYRSDMATNQPLTLLAIPVAGLAAALLILCAGFFFRHFLPSQNGAAILFALTATIFLELKDSGRGTGLILAALNMMAGKVPMAALLPRLKAPTMSSLSGVVPTAGLILAEIIKIGVFALLFRAQAEDFLVVVLVISFAMQGMLMTLDDLESASPYLEVPKKQAYSIWFTAGFIALFIFISHPLAVLIALGAAFAAAWYLREYFEENFGGTTAEIITLTGATAELVLLLVGGILLA